MIASDTNPAGLLVPNTEMSPPQTVVFLIKFLTSDEHAESLVRGMLHAKRLAHHKRREAAEADGRLDPLEGAEADGRLDRHEGTSSWMQPGSVELQVNGWNLTPDLAGPVQIQPRDLDRLNVFCVHAGHIDTTPPKGTVASVDDGRRRLLVPERCLELGEHAVVVKDVPEFMRRFGAAIEREGYRAWTHLVRYYDPSTFHGHFDGIDAVFRKQIKYGYQREYRFAIDTRRTDDPTPDPDDEASDPKDGALDLDIGDIRDITLRLRSEDLNGAQFLGGTIEFA
ncbi:MAG: hypothetical protein F4236_09740 [Acidimicrobiia bacterium]|nr:hypothetical protein [Acidimicrobiia bacterium]